LRLSSSRRRLSGGLFDRCAADSAAAGAAADAWVGLGDAIALL